MKYYIWLQCVLPPGNSRVQEVLSTFGTAENVYHAGTEKLRKSGLFTPKELERAQKTPLEKAESILFNCKNAGIATISIASESYPQGLRNISNPPLVLYIKGLMPNVDEEPTFCIVGPRKVSPFGEKAAYSLAMRLAKSGMVVVSGCALGTDTAVHTGAIKAGGITIGVLPCGILNGYLPENLPLRSQIEKSGCLLSEYPPDKSVGPGSFHVRNRILSALCVGTAVIEAGERSGALITAHHACEQGRDVFVIPGNPTLPHYKGSNQLLREGARPLLDASDIFNEYLPRFAEKIDIKKAFEKVSQSQAEKPSEPSEKEEPKVPSKKILDQGLSNEAKIVYNHLNGQKFSADDLIDTGIADDQLLSALTELEMAHYIKAIPGGLYTLI